MLVAAPMLLMAVAATAQPSSPVLSESEPSAARILPQALARAEEQGESGVE